MPTYKLRLFFLLPFWDTKPLDSFRFRSHIHSRFHSHVKYWTVTAEITFENNYFGTYIVRVYY